jgi:hypothetical protein
MGGYDWTLLPLAAVQDALRLTEGEIVIVRVPGVNGEFTAHRAFVQRLVETRSAMPPVASIPPEESADGDHEHRNSEGASEFR